MHATNAPAPPSKRKSTARREDSGRRPYKKQISGAYSTRLSGIVAVSSSCSFCWRSGRGVERQACCALKPHLSPSYARRHWALRATCESTQHAKKKNTQKKKNSNLINERAYGCHSVRNPPLSGEHNYLYTHRY